MASLIGMIKPKRKMKKKTKSYNLQGLLFYDFSDEEVLNNLSQVEEKIKKRIEEKEKQKI